MSSRGSGRPGRTGLTVKLTEQSVSKFIPIVSPQPSGMTHQVAQTWTALKNLATMFERLNPINQQNLNSPRLFPRGAMALLAAGDNTPAKQDVAGIISSAEAANHRDLWAQTSPGSVLLLPHGGSIAAVADIWDVSYDAPTGVLSLELDVVHDPHTVSEFEPHGKQTLDVDTSHYHFDTAPGVKVDAEALLKSLQETGFGLEGVHLFFKEGCPTYVKPAPEGFVVQATEDPDVFDITVTVIQPTCPSAINPATIGGFEIYLQCTNCNFLSVSGCSTDCKRQPNNATTKPKTPTREPHRRGQQPAGIDPKDQVPSREAFIDNSGNWAYAYATVTDAVATATIQVLSSGEPFQVTPGADYANGDRPYYIGNCGGSQPTGSVTKLLLEPAKAYRHLHDPITLTVTAFDASGVKVPDAAVAFSMYGDCTPKVLRKTNTTDANGRATITLVGYEPGVVSIVAAAAGGADGAPVLSNPSHLFFFEERHYVDHREGEYYSGKHMGRDAHTYAATAYQMAKDQIKGVTKSN